MKKRFKYTQRGAAAVEFAIVLPILVLLMGGLIEFGIILYNQHMINNATREGARFAIDPFIQPEDETENDVFINKIKDKVKAYCKQNEEDTAPTLLITFGNGNDPDLLSVNITKDTVVNVGEVYTVTANYNYQFLFFHKLPFVSNFDSTLALTASTTMKIM